MDKKSGTHNSVDNIENNPCLKEHKMSLTCLSENNYDSEQCQNHFLNYRTCHSFWSDVKRYRRINGIRPILPSAAERETIKKQYFETGKFH